MNKYIRNTLIAGFVGIASIAYSQEKQNVKPEITPYDLDGDGKMDYMLKDNGSIKYLINKDRKPRFNPTQEQFSIDAPKTFIPDTVRYEDFNGDKLEDIILVIDGKKTQYFNKDGIYEKMIEHPIDPNEKHAFLKGAYKKD
ncbi:MAG TPA: VCBS repeat-containing protein [Alphaproteobacteria bacterium]|nr:VCBS repeat-containing protein [Alphaproteobacteria bacterium]